MKLLCKLYLIIIYGASAYAIMPTTRELMIFCECGESENMQLTLNQKPYQESIKMPVIQAVAARFLTALYQEASPLLATKQTVDNILEHKALFDEFTQPAPDKNARVNELFTKFNQYSYLSTKTAVEKFYDHANYNNMLYNELVAEASRPGITAEKLKHALWSNHKFERSIAPVEMREVNSDYYKTMSTYLVCAKLPLDRYLIYDIPSAQNKHDGLYLCIPKSYLKKINPRQNITPQELGLNYQKFKLVELKPTTRFIKKPLENTSCQEHLLNSLPEIFIADDKLSADQKHIWAICIIGHGTYEPDVGKKIADNNRKLENQERNLRYFSEQLKQREQMLKENKKTANQNLLKEALAVTQQNINITKKNINILNRNIEILSQANLVAGLTIPQFQRFLQFLNNYITTGLLFYSSCFAGGQHFIDAYKDATSGLLLPFNYPIVADALTEAVTEEISPQFSIYWYKDNNNYYQIPVEKIVNMETKRIKIRTPYNFAAFFEQLQKSSDPTDKTRPDSYAELFNNISLFLQQVKSNEKKFNIIRPEGLKQLPSIRFPGTTWFNVVDIPNRILAFTQVKTGAQAEQPLVINKTLEHAKDAVLLYVPTVNFTLQVERDRDKKMQFPAIVSMIPGKATHKIKEINAPDYKLSEIVSKLFPFDVIKSSKAIIIENLSCINDADIPGIKSQNAQEFTKVIAFINAPIEQDRFENSIFFKIGDTDYLYGFTWQDQTTLPESAIKNIKKIADRSSLIKKNIDFLSQQDMPNALLIKGAQPKAIDVLNKKLAQNPVLNKQMRVRGWQRALKDLDTNLEALSKRVK